MPRQTRRTAIETPTTGVTRAPRTAHQQYNRADYDGMSCKVRNYSTNVLDFHQMDNTKRCYGIELEVATTKTNEVQQRAREVYQIVRDDAILKSDCSISGYRKGQYWDGFEMVTRPMSFENQIIFWKNFLKKKPADLRSEEPGSCGLHIHVSRKALSPLTLGKLLVFVNDEENETWIRNRITRRESRRWAKRMDVKLGKFAIEGRDKRGRHFDRYQKINMTNLHTIEFRMFKGTTGKRLFACIEFVDSLIEFCQATAIPNINLEMYCKYVQLFPKRYPNLQSRVKDNGKAKTK